ncbi:unnamed protein product [Rotaria magnacalcarata]
MRKIHSRRLCSPSCILIVSLILILIFTTRCQYKQENTVDNQEKNFIGSTEIISIPASTIPTKYLVVPYYEFVMRTSITCRKNKIDNPGKNPANLYPKYSKYLRGPFSYVIPSTNITFDDVEQFYIKTLVNKPKNKQMIETHFAKNITFENIPYVFKDGLWFPVGVTSAQRTAILVTLQGRYYNAKTFLLNIHAFLRRQQLTYTVMFIEQVAPVTPRFNKGRLYNTAINYLEKQSLNITCLILHDVDLIPEDDGNYYTCERNHPKHTTIRVRKLNDTRGYTRYYEFLVGGVLLLTFDMYKQFNGFSNLYWGWGGEDDDLALRFIEQKMCVVRPTYESAIYIALQHPTGKRNSARFGLLTWSTLRLYTDGYEQIESLTRIVHINQTSIVTHLQLDVDATRDHEHSASSNAIKIGGIRTIRTKPV